MIETCCKRANRRAGAGLPGIRVEDVHDLDVARCGWVLSIEFKILVLLGAGKLGEGNGYGQVGARFADVEKRCFAKDEGAGWYWGRGKAPETLSRRRADIVEGVHRYEQRGRSLS